MSSSRLSRYTKRGLPLAEGAHWESGEMALLSLGRVLTVLTQEQADYIGVKIDVPFKGSRFNRGCYRLQRLRYVPPSTVDLGELFAYRARVRDDPGMRARSRRTIWNRARLRRTVCDRARPGLAGSTGTWKVSKIVPNCTVSLGSSQGTNPRTGGLSKRKTPLTKVFP